MSIAFARFYTSLKVIYFIGFICNMSHNVHYSIIRMYILKHARYVTCYRCYMCRGTFDIWHIVEYVYKGIY